MCDSEVAALGAFCPEYHVAFEHALANNLVSRKLVADLHAAVAGATDVSTAAILRAENC